MDVLGIFISLSRLPASHMWQNYGVKFWNFLMRQQMLPKFSVDPWDAMVSLYDLNHDHYTVFRGVLKPPVLLPTLELPPIFFFLSKRRLIFYFLHLCLHGRAKLEPPPQGGQARSFFENPKKSVVKNSFKKMTESRVLRLIFQTHGF